MLLDRRSFVQVSASAAGAFLAPSLMPSGRAGTGARVDVLFRGGRIYDGSGALPVTGDVLVRGDRIADVARSISAPGVAAIDLDGLAIAPGFIDIHSHTDLELAIDPRAESKVRQGVTTEIAGQDGSSIGPYRPDDARALHQRYRETFGVTFDFSDLAGFFTWLERHPGAVNVASMVGHGSVRAYVIGRGDRRATSDELARMRGLVADALRAGACGLSSGLEYVPGAFADQDELAALAEMLNGTGLPYASHMRNEDDQLFAAVEEALNVGRRAGVPVHVSHLKAQGQRNWWKAEPVLDTLSRAYAAGLEVTYDRYPYVAYSTGLGSLFPVWARDGGTDAFLARLDAPALADRIERAVRDKIATLGNWDAVQITALAADSLAWAEGRRLGALAAERNLEPYALLLALIRGDRNRSGMVGFGMSEENTDRVLGHPLGMICSDGSALAIDGPLSAGTPHPRNFGSFPRVLGHYCREKGVMPLETAIHKMTALPARRLRLAGRGAIAPGAFADLVVFDPATVADRATFTHPHQYPVGILHVLVNGTFVLRDGARTDARPGRVVRPVQDA